MLLGVSILNDISIRDQWVLYPEQLIRQQDKIWGRHVHKILKADINMVRITMMHQDETPPSWQVVITVADKNFIWSNISARAAERLGVKLAAWSGLELLWETPNSPAKLYQRRMATEPKPPKRPQRQAIELPPRRGMMTYALWITVLLYVTSRLILLGWSAYQTTTPSISWLLVLVSFLIFWRWILGITAIIPIMLPIILPIEFVWPGTAHWLFTKVLSIQSLPIIAHWLDQHARLLHWMQAHDYFLIPLLYLVTVSSLLREVLNHWRVLGSRWHLHQRFQKEGVVTQGTITQKWQGYTDDARDNLNQVAYTYPGGEETSLTVSPKIYEQIKPGDFVEVRYLRNNPAMSFVVNQ